MSNSFDFVPLPDLVDLKMGETIIASQCTGDGVPVFSADKGLSPWNYSSKIKVINSRGALVVGARGTIGYPRLPNFDKFGATQTTIVATPRSRAVDSAFLYYCLCSVDFSTITAQQAVPMLTVADLRKVQVPRFSPPTQQKIASILQTIDRAIEQTAALIDKYQQIKAGLMHDLFTRGIGPDGQLRPPREHAPHLYQQTPIGWIPKEWEVRSTLDIVEFPVGQVSPLTYPYIDMTLVAPDHVEKETGRLLLQQTAREQGAISGKYVFKSGDIVYSKIRPYLRKAILADFEGICSADMYPLRVKTGSNPVFIFGMILGDQFSRYAEAVSMRSGFPKINRSEFAGFSCGIPPGHEQEQFASVIRSADANIVRNEELLQKLQKQKSGLMHDLLTGKVPVTLDPEPAHG